MADFFIKRPVFAIVLSIIIMIVGGVAAFNLPIAQYPNISPPTISVQANYMGANADVVDQTVAQIIEQQVNGVEDMTYMSSTSTDTGAYSLSVNFETGKNSNIASVLTQNRVAAAAASLPSAVQSAGVTTKKSARDTSLMFNLYSENNAYSTNFLGNYASIYLIDEIKRVNGVGEVQEFGSDYAMRIWLQPEKMSRLGIAVEDVTAAIEKQNVQAPVGSIGKMPASSQQEFQSAARVKGRLSEVQEFEDVIVKSRNDGSFIRLQDVAKVELASKEYNFLSYYKDYLGTGFGIKMTSDANVLETVSDVKKVLDEAAENFPEGMKYATIVDTSKFISESMTEVAKTFVEALLLVVLVVYLFLQSWRATLISLLAVPVSLVGTFAAFTVMDFTINTLTMFAMVLAIGLVVDDAIVVIEAVEYHMRHEGLQPLEATKKAMSEVSGPVVAIAFVLAAIFIPVAFFGGMMGVLYKQFALTIAVSMALSAIVALSLTPALCTLLLKPYQPNVNVKTNKATLFFASFNSWLKRQTENYGNGLQKLIGKASLCMAALAVIVVLLGVLYYKVPSTFIPDEDQGYFIVSVTLPEASSLNRTRKTLLSFWDKVKEVPGVAGAMPLAGMDILGGGSKSNGGVMFTFMEPWSERENEEKQINAVTKQISLLGSEFQEGRIIAFNPPALPGLGILGGFTLYLQDRSGGTIEQLDDVAQKFIAAALARPEIASAASNLNTGTPGYEFEIDREKSEKMGVPLKQVFSALQAFLGGTQVNDFNKFDRTYKVIVQADTSYRGDIEAMRSLYVKSTDGTMVPLNTLITYKKISAPALITRYNGVKAVQISGSPASGYSSGQALTALEDAAKETLPGGYTYEWSGQSLEEKQSGSRAPLVFGLAIVFTFLCLAALYESWSVPFAMLLSVPLGLFGAFVFQYARGLENSIYMQIGLVMLIGLAPKNAILIVEYAKVRVDNGMEPVQAAIEAAKLRLRPIIMTSLAFIIGCVPLALASGAGAGARNSMGTAVVGGMLMATTFGIFLIPVLFVVVEKIIEKINSWHKAKEAGNSMDNTK